MLLVHVYMFSHKATMVYQDMYMVYQEMHHGLSGDVYGLSGDAPWFIRRCTMVYQEMHTCRFGYNKVLFGTTIYNWSEKLKDQIKGGF